MAYVNKDKRLKYSIVPQGVTKAQRRRLASPVGVMQSLSLHWGVTPLQGVPIGMRNVDKQTRVREGNDHKRVQLLMGSSLLCKHVGLAFKFRDRLDAFFGLTLAFWSGRMLGDEKTVAIF